MPTATVKTREVQNTNRLLTQVLKEVRSLREDFSLFLPQEDIREYAHPSHIKNSYLKALKKYPRQA